MALFTRLEAAALAEIAARFSLGSVQRAEPLAAGTINSNFSVETATGHWFVRVNEGKAQDDVAWEAALVEALAAGGVTTPPPMPATDGRPYAPLGTTGKWVSVFPWRAGHHLDATAVTKHAVHELGVALGELHRVGLELPAAWRRPSIYDHDHLVARHAGFSALPDPVLSPAIPLLAEALTFAGERTAIRQRATHGIIHGDLFRDNVLWEADRLVAILDFEQASGGSLVYDLAVCINDWCWTGEPRLELVGALLDGYRSRRALSEADRAALPIEVRAAAARFTITRITDVYLARVPNPDKDFRAFLARCEAWKGPALGQLSSLL
ncbi:MAG: homoserine kinase [Kofleriaceae bacterium]